MTYRWHIIWVAVLAIGLPSCSESDDRPDYESVSSVAELLKRKITPEVQTRICDLLETDAEQRTWLADAFETLDSREQMGAVQAVCCVGMRNAFAEFHAIIGFALKDEYMSVYAQQCLLDYDIPNRRGTLRKHVDREAKAGSSIMFLRTYLAIYGPGDIARIVNTKLTGKKTHDEHKAEIALALIRHGQKKWLRSGLGVLKKLMNPPVNLYKRAPNLAADVFKTLAEERCDGCDGLKDAADEAAANGAEPARTSAQDYLDAFNL